MVDKKIKEIQPLFDSLGVNGEGKMEYDRLVAVYVHVADKDPTESATKVYQELNKPKAEAFSLEDYVTATSEASEAPKLFSLMAFMHGDANKDGKLGFEEYCNLIEIIDKIGIISGLKSTKEGFDKLDADKDEFLTYSDMKAWFDSLK